MRDKETERNEPNRERGENVEENEHRMSCLCGPASLECREKSLLLPLDAAICEEHGDHEEQRERASIAKTVAVIAIIAGDSKIVAMRSLFYTFRTPGRSHTTLSGRTMCSGCTPASHCSIEWKQSSYIFRMESSA